MKRLVIFVGSAALAVNVWAEPPRLTLTLSEVVAAALREAPELEAAGFRSESAEDHARSLRGKFMPRFGIEGSFKRVSEVPTLPLPAGNFTLTDNESYSIGSGVHYTLFRGGADLNAWKSAKAQSRSKRLQDQLLRRQRRLAAELAYFQAQLAAEQVRLLVESYKVEEQQHRDIQNQFRAGSAARTDLLSAHQQTLNRRRQLLDARADLAVALREVTRLTGLGADVDPRLPLDGQTGSAPPENVDAPTVVLEIPAPSDTIARLTAQFRREFDQGQPGIAFLSELADAARLAAKSLQGARWPELSVMGKVSRDYPNGPIRETITQRTIGASLNFPLFAGGELFYGARAKTGEAKAVEKDRDAIARDLLSSWGQANDQLAALRAQQPLFDATIREARELARLQYQSYRAGRARYLDVEDANLKVLQARTDAARADVRILVQLATLESLSIQKE